MDANKQLFLEYLRQIYDQANEHLREQEHKRDQLVTFYAVLISFFITTNGAISKNFGGTLTTIFLNLGLFVIGIVVCTTISSLRGWHSQYLDVIYVINFVIAHEESYETVDDLKNALQNKVIEDQTIGKNNNSATNNSKKNPFKKIDAAFKSTENAMFFGMVIFSFVPLLMLGHGAYKYMIKWGIFHNYEIVPAVLLWIVFAVFAVLYFKWMERTLIATKANANIYRTWMLDFDYYSNGASNHDYYDVSWSQGVVSLRQKTAGVVTVPTVGNQYLMIKIKRSDGRLNWEFPRGFVEPEEINGDVIDYSAAAKRELNEELDIPSVDVIKTTDLGEIEPDSGLIVSSIHVMSVDISELKGVKLQSSEKIVEYRLMDKVDVLAEVKKGMIIDGFTLSAITLSQNRE